MISLWNFNLAGTHTFLYNGKQFTIAVIWLRGSDINGLLRGFAANLFAKLITWYHIQFLAVMHSLSCMLLVMKMPTGGHPLVEKFWQPQMNQKNWDNSCRGLSSNPSVAKEEQTSSVPLSIIGMGAVIGQAY